MVDDKKRCGRLARSGQFLALAALFSLGSNAAVVAQAPPFDGRPWNLSTGNLSVAFVIAALGACAWFLSYRAQMSSKIVDDESSEEPEDEVSTGSDSDRVEREDDN